MSCQRAFEIDLAEFLHGGTQDDSLFREHYPVCPECALEVRAWTDLHVLLQVREDGSGNGHPEPELLLQYQDQSPGLGSAARALLQRHLASCHACRDELASLRRFELPAKTPGRSRLEGTAEVLRGLFLHPAFAYALVLLLLYPAVTGYFDPAGLSSIEPVSRVVRERSPAPSPAPSLAPSAPPNAARKARVKERRTELADSETLMMRSLESRTARALSRPADEPGRRAASASYAFRAMEVAPGLAAMPSELRPATGGAWMLRVRPPPEVRRGPEFEVRVTQTDGRREIRTRFKSADVGAEVEVGLPSDWDLDAGYTVEFKSVE